MPRRFSLRQIDAVSARRPGVAHRDPFAVGRVKELTRLMRVTKFEHAALRLDAGEQTLLIDPGSFTAPLDDLNALVGIVITHEHPDHWTPEHFDRLLRAAPDTPIFAPSGVARAAEGYDITVVSPGDTVEVGAFTLRFFGGRHEIIHSSLPVVENVGVLVNDELYYPGDSYAVPEGVEVGTLAAPLGAPWLKIGEAIDFVLAVAPRRAFGTHDMTLSVIGKNMHRQRLQWATEQDGGEFFVLEPGDTIDL
jgi:L-ascorbate metabolism protein UlaG (beta-lactamase superfamily)